jgi:16S rRNA G966 N2-methylase RsmD
LIQKNLRSLDVTSGFKIVESDLSQALWRIQREHVTADVVFLDPPYHMKQVYGQALQVLMDSSLVWAMSVVIAEHEKRFDPGDEFGPLKRFRRLVQGDAALSFFRMGHIPIRSKHGG